MPLEKSKSREAVGRNIAREEAAGKPRDQSIAIALDVARKAGADIPKKHIRGGKRMFNCMMRRLGGRT